MIGVVLAGGSSKRMGLDKATVPVAGRPMLAWVLAAITPVCEEVVVSGRSAPSDVRVVADPPTPHRGPLAGLVAAQAAFPADHLLVVAVDQPWMLTETAARLAETTRDLAVVPVESGVRQTTCAVYPPNLAGLATEELRGGGSLQSLLDLASFVPVVDWHEWGEDGRSWFSADTPEAIDLGMSRFGPPSP